MVHLPFADLVLGPVSAGLFTMPAFVVLAWLRRRAAPWRWESLVRDIRPVTFFMALWLISVGVYLWVEPGNKLADLCGMAECDALLLGLLALLTPASWGRRRGDPAA
jgi:hypothetical protein